jgi:hypothetical protein
MFASETKIYCNGQRIFPARGVAAQKEDVARTAFKEKERRCTVKLFGTNSLKEGEV